MVGVGGGLCLESCVFDVTAGFTLMKSQIGVGISWAGQVTSGRNVIRLGTREQTSFHIVLCVVKRNFVSLGTLIGGSKWFPELERELWKKTRVTGRASLEGRAADRARPCAPVDRFGRLPIAMD